MEIAAVYWESKIKMYGFNEAVDLSMLKMTFAADQMAETGVCISRLDDLGIRFRLALAQHDDSQKINIYLLSGDQWDDTVLKLIKQEIGPDTADSARVESPVELVYFQGPHFGDRYGIAFSAFSMLESHHIDILLAGCSGSAIYLVLPKNGIERARPFLSEIFEVP